MGTMSRVEDLFHEASALPKAQRGEFLDRHCSADPALRAQVERLLATEESATTGILAWSPEQSEADPSTIGPYIILGLLGEGGMGRVYEAQQASPKRSVALKVIRSGLGTAEGLRRFIREAEVLAHL
ncbi:MAG: serine/threonine protein kinase, partial [Phycisphaerales bacterium]